MNILFLNEFVNLKKKKEEFNELYVVYLKISFSYIVE